MNINFGLFKEGYFRDFFTPEKWRHVLTSFYKK